MVGYPDKVVMGHRVFSVENVASDGNYVDVFLNKVLDPVNKNTIVYDFTFNDILTVERVVKDSICHNGIEKSRGT
jgi:hypothetical protein